MARTIKSAAQRQHEKTNNALRVEANKRRRAAKRDGKAALKANMKAMSDMGKKVRADRQQAHIERNIAMAEAAAQRRADRAAASNDNGSVGLAA